MRLSIIIPAYNVEAYIEKCICSLQQQDLDASEYEIIVTNDGSPDKSREIVEKLQKEFRNIILINQENQGVSMARNNAIAIAKGKYVLAIDPDDYILPNTLRRVLSLAESKDVDVFYLGFEIFDQQGKSVWHTNYEALQDKIYNGVDGYFKPRGSAVRDPDRSVAMLYKKTILDQYAIRYPQNVPYLEDGLFLAKVFAVAGKVGFDNTSFYQRTTRLGSATNSELFYSEKAVQGFINAIKDLQLFDSINNFPKDQKLLINHVVAKFTFLPLTSFIGKKSISDYFKFIKKLKALNLNTIQTEGLRLGYHKMAVIFNVSPLLFYIHFAISAKLKNYRQK